MSSASMPLGRRARFGIVATIFVLTALLYWPGLGGDYIQDDYPNLVDNAALRVDAGSANAWLEAAWSSPSSDLRRPLASLTFAANYAVAGLAPRPMKLVNLAIHLLNGVLLFALLRRLVRLASRDAPDDERGFVLAALVTAIWLLHPINLTGVLYVVQRMESLAQVFVLAGLILYVDARVALRDGSRGAMLRLWIGVPLCTALGLLAKESAVLLPAYALLIEWIVLAGSRTPRETKTIGAFFTLFLVLPTIAALAWLVPRFMNAAAYEARPFTLAERLLTEPRVMLDYIGSILLPLPSAFSLYQDDYRLSTGLLQPPSTLLAIALLIAMTVAGVLMRRRRPLIALGLLGFLVAHSMTATFIPLEIKYEHRNYFASALLLLALADLVLPPHLREAAFARARVFALVALAALAAFSLALRAREWSNPLTLALTEVARHPESPRATYELGRTYTLLSGYRADSPLLARAIEALQRAADVPNARILPEVALLNIAGRTNRPIDAHWWESIHAKLAARTPGVENIAALAELTECQRYGHCPTDDDAMLKIYLAAIDNPRPHPAAFYSYAIFAFNRLHDDELALRLARAAADTPPRDPQYRLNLVNFLIDRGHYDEARHELATLRGHTHLGRLAAGIADAEKKLERSASEPATHAESG